MFKYLYLFCFFVCYGCSSVHNLKSDPVYVNLTDKIKIQLADFTPEVDLNFTQLLNISFGGQQHSMIAVLQTDTSQLNIVGLSSMGIKLFSAQYDSKQITVNKHIPISDIPPATQVLSDIFFAFYPKNILDKYLRNGVYITDYDNVREIREKDGSVIQRVSYVILNGRRLASRIEHIWFKYTIDIQYIDGV